LKGHEVIETVGLPRAAGMDGAHEDIAYVSTPWRVRKKSLLRTYVSKHITGDGELLPRGTDESMLLRRQGLGREEGEAASHESTEPEGLRENRTMGFDAVGIGNVANVATALNPCRRANPRPYRAADGGAHPWKGCLLRPDCRRMAGGVIPPPTRSLFPF